MVRNQFSDGKGLHYRGSLDQLARCGNPRWWLLRQREFQLIEQHLKFLLRLGVARQDHMTAVGRWQMNIDHLHCRKFIQYRSRRKPRGQITQPSTQRHMQAIRQECHENVRFNPILSLMVNRTQARSPLRFLNASSTWVSWV